MWWTPPGRQTLLPLWATWCKRAVSSTRPICLTCQMNKQSTIILLVEKTKRHDRQLHGVDMIHQKIIQCAGIPKFRARWLIYSTEKTLSLNNITMKLFDLDRVLSARIQLQLSLCVVIAEEYCSHLWWLCYWNYDQWLAIYANCLLTLGSVDDCHFLCAYSACYLHV